MTIYPVYQIGQTTSITKESPKKISFPQQSSGNTTSTPKDTVTISSAARDMAAKMSNQTSTAQSTNSFNGSQQAQIASTGSNLYLNSNSKSAVKIVTPRQKDLESFLAGRSFQEEFSESMVEKLQEQLVDVTY